LRCWWLIGIALLLPGICSLIFMIPFMLGQGPVGEWVIAWLITFIIAAGGIGLSGTRCGTVEIRETS
jgi:hypothetical protein